jgi:oligoendopeptidase F
MSIETARIAERLACALLTIALLAPAAGRTAERSEIPEKYRWDLSDLFESDAAWASAKKELVAAIPGLAKWQGRLGESSQTLADAMAAYENVARQADRIYAYGLQRYDEDTRVSGSLSMKQEAIQAYTDLQSATAWMRPEILAVGKPAIDRFLAEQPSLAQYRQYFDDVLRAAPHTRSPGEEKIIAQTGAMAQAGGSVHSVFTSADMPFPEITLSTGEKVRIDAAGYTRYRAASNKADRDKVFDAFWTTYGAYTRTLAATLDSHVQTHVFNKNVRNFDSSLDAALFDFNIPQTVYSQLLADVHRNLPTLHRYFRLRQRIMGLDQLGYEDLYAPIIPSVSRRYTPEEAQQITIEAFAPLGPEYVGVLSEGYENRWVDFMPSTGKSAGAYSNAVYGVHPYQLLNFNGAYEDVSTLAHESGHSMHSYLSLTSQPYATAYYSTFVAEVASTLNEGLLLHHMLNRTQDDATRLSLLSSFLDGMRATLFRQTLFAEFELRIHEAVERGEPLTSDSLNKLYLELLRTYHGHDQGVVRIDDKYAAEWAYIPHFYRNFYVYQYATSMVAGLSLADGIIGDAAKKSGTATQNRDRYLTLLKSGSSKYPIELLKDAGVDMTTSAPFDAAVREMNRVMDEMEKIYAKQGAD